MKLKVNYELQWGRGFSAAEMMRDGAMRSVECGFNGAAAFQPRKSQRPYPWLRASRASMGPRLFSRGNSVENGQ